jgi:2-hydroxychromene-2-carboxylate isomerase
MQFTSPSVYLFSSAINHMANKQKQRVQTKHMRVAGRITIRLRERVLEEKADIEDGVRSTHATSK